MFIIKSIKNNNFVIKFSVINFYTHANMSKNFINS